MFVTQGHVALLDIPESSPGSSPVSSGAFPEYCGGSCCLLYVAFLDALEVVPTVSGSRVKAQAEGLHGATHGIRAGVRGVL